MNPVLNAADGTMIARGDLGVEVPIERIAIIQKDLMRQANRRAKPVITATQMLESMTENRWPTRVSTIKMKDCEDAGQSIVPSGSNTESGPGLLEWDYDHNDGRRVSANKPAAVKTGASSKSN